MSLFRRYNDAKQQKQKQLTLQPSIIPSEVVDVEDDDDDIADLKNIDSDSDSDNEDEVQYIGSKRKPKHKVKKNLTQSHLQQMELKMPGGNHPMLFLKERGPLNASHHDHVHHNYGGKGNIIITGSNAKVSGGVGNKTITTTAAPVKQKAKKIRGSTVEQLKASIKNNDGSISDLQAIAEVKNQSGGRWSGSKAEKLAMCLEYNKQIKEGQDSDEAYAHVCSIYGSYCPARSTIYQWKRELKEDIEKAEKADTIKEVLKEDDFKVAPRGKKVNERFESAVRDKLWLQIVAEIPSDEKGESKELITEDIINITYSYEMIKKAITDVQNEWLALYEANDLSDEDLKATNAHKSDGYIHDWLQRQVLSKRVMETEADRKMPTPSAIQERHKAIAVKIKTGNYTRRRVGTGDETAIRWMDSMRHKFSTQNEKVEDDSNDHLRFTSFEWAHSAGGDDCLQPPFIIIYCTVDSFDLGSTEVIKNLHRKFESNPDTHGRFVYDEWRQKFTFKRKDGTTYEANCVRPYLKDTATGAIITCQKKAWMDTVGLLMLGHLMLRPYAIKWGRLMLIWDNVSCHCCQVVVDNYKHWGIDLEFILPNSSRKTQVADLIINGPLKAYQRQGRALSHYNYFQDFAKRVRRGEKVKWDPPSLELHEGVLLHLGAHQKMNLGAVPAAVKTCFETLGFCANDQGQYQVYRSHEIYIPAALKDIDVTPTTASGRTNELSKVCIDEIYSLVQVTPRREIDEVSDEPDDAPQGVAPQTVTIVAPSAPVVLSVHDIMKMDKTRCLRALEERGLPMSTKESLLRLRTTLIENFTAAAAPPPTTTNPPPPPTPPPPPPTTTGTHPTTPPPSPPAHTASTNHLDLMEEDEDEEDSWCLCKKPNDGRKYVQCSRAHRCTGAKDGWYHPQCLKHFKWQGPQKGEKSWKCFDCLVSIN